MPNNPQDSESRRTTYQLAKEILKNENASTQLIKSCLSMLPASGHKALALRLRLDRKLNGLPHGWDDIQ